MNRFESDGIDSLLVREPGGTRISEEIRDVLLKNRNENMAVRTEALLMTASRAQLTHDIIIPSLDSGLIVIADRFKDSTLAYQGGGRGLDINYLLQLNEFATFELDPDITFFIDVTADEGHKRLNSKHPDRIEGAGKIFQEKVREQYLKLAQIYSERFIVLDGEKTPEEIHRTVWLEINKKQEK